MNTIPLESIKKLGFGTMRLPKLPDGQIDLEQACQMTDAFMEHGYNYVDTAYGYLEGRSEETVRKMLVERYPREKFFLATKMPVWCCNEKQDVQRVFDEQLARTGAGYFDFYLVHAVDGGKLEKLEKLGVWDFVAEQKKKGLVRHIGFSYHDSADLLEKVLSQHPEAEFVQLQINYLDWESERIQSRRCYEVCRQHNLPVVVMEPVKGGMLASLPEEIEGVFKSMRPDMTAASWAIEYAASLDGVMTVLSGMSDLEQMQDNLRTMDKFEPLDELEQGVVDRVRQMMCEKPSIPCTNCRYCVPECPMKINLPDIFEAYNLYLALGDQPAVRARYQNAVRDGGRASDCLRCGSCESICPQHMDCIEWLEECAKIFDK